ncbi:hypothetical protein AAFF_G00097760 [Aldrovandia affinis]|uniref:Uncharacterized protein n=1 Tax=Aldrovandia affinis TaxID=143900 RepID=A0AAD7RVC9_9TELE|nr:hypothetical protein AAFF_G00097760 [Aldrovandia affinis]
MATTAHLVGPPPRQRPSGRRHLGKVSAGRCPALGVGLCGPANEHRQGDFKRGEFSQFSRVIDISRERLFYIFYTLNARIKEFELRPCACEAAFGGQRCGKRAKVSRRELKQGFVSPEGFDLLISNCLVCAHRILFTST